MNQEDKFEYSKNHKFALRGLKILKDLNTKNFDRLDESLKNKILDFQLYIVEIDETQNPNFDPIDLFIRLNDKPYPIRENSFEMWNSWVIYDIIEEIKATTKKIKPWFYLRQLKDDNDRDRMENEELLTSLIFLEYSKQINDARKTLDLYQKAQRINGRIGSKSYISSLLLQVSEGADNSKEHWASAFKAIKNFIYKLKIVLLDQDKPDSELYPYISSELDTIFKAGKRTKYFRRVTQDFYLTWFLLSDLHIDLVKYARLEIKEALKDIFKYIKNIPESETDKQGGIRKFQELATELKLWYSSDKKGRLSAHEIAEHFSTIDKKPSREGPKFSADNIGLEDLFVI